MGGDRNTLEVKNGQFRIFILNNVANPKYAMANDHPTADIQVIITGSEPSSVGSRSDNAGRIPTNPAANGI